jgi:hypothetical protein
LETEVPYYEKLAIIEKITTSKLISRKFLGNLKTREILLNTYKFRLYIFFNILMKMNNFICLILLAFLFASAVEARRSQRHRIFMKLDIADSAEK